MNLLKGLKPIKKNFYLNPVAMLFCMAQQLEKILIAGRAFGKSFVNGILVMIYVASMPRSRGLLLGPTYTQILTNSLAPMKSAWAWFGYLEGIDYVVGKRPPKHFDHPYLKPDRYENVISWWNGTIILLGSMDRPELIRGGNNDWSITDETLLVDRTKYLRTADKTVRGSHLLLKDKPGHLTQVFTTSMPYGTVGKWIMDRKILAENPENNIHFSIATSWHNRKIIGDKVLKAWQRNAKEDPLTYLVEVMSVYVKQLGSLFYPALTDNHWYNAENYLHIDQLGFDIKEKRDCRWDKDYDPDKPLNVSHDFGALNCITIDQEWDRDPWFDDRESVRMINFMFVKHPRLIQDLAKDFCEYYRFARCKEIVQWGDKSGNKSEPNSVLTYFEEFATILEKNGWRVIPGEKGDAGHLARHKFIADMHREEDERLPIVRYNAGRCKDLRIALESAGMLDQKKDKSSERSKIILQEHATHGTDAHDYRLWWGFRVRILDRSYSSPVSFGG